METEVEVKMACPLGRRRGEIPTREWDREINSTLKIST
jgi:hypothetical protein